ncbi:MAG TPA: hypothetical protein VFI33_00785 [Puia sp.]|nr:hypothetical protein [Puia sp.]
MGNITSGSDFTGSVGPITVFKMRGHDKLVIRSKGGVSRRKIKTHANFDATRRLNQEWKVVTACGAELRQGLYALKPLADYNVSGPLNALIKKIQTSDTINEKGKRSILFSRYPDFLSSFQFNRQTLFDSVIRRPLEVKIDKSTAIATVSVPELQPGIHLFPNPKYAYYRLTFDLSAISDRVWNEETGSYNQKSALLPDYKHFYTAWVPASSTQPANNYQISPAIEPFSTGPDMILILGAGIQYGMPAPDGSIQPVPYAGAARILKCV